MPRSPSGLKPSSRPLFKFSALPARNLRQDVLGAVRSAILDGQLPAGERLLEAEIAAQMEVSRAPVREAVRQLEQEGLLEVLPHRGSTVIGVPEDEVDAIYEMRAVIESKAARKACMTITDGELAFMDQCLQTMEAALKKDDITTVYDMDLQFHAAMIDASGYRLLRRMWQSMDGMIRARSYRALHTSGAATSYFRTTALSSHRAILVALASRDPDAAAAVVRAHILEVSARIAEEPAPVPRRRNTRAHVSA